MNYEETLSWIHSISRFGMNQGLERIKTLLSYLGDPQAKLNFLHIGGTNGKGSTAAFAASVLESAGYKVGLYTSPYLVQFTNRMSINGRDIPRKRLVELVERVKPLTEKIASDPDLGQPTEFEVVTALALTYFAQEAPDLVVLEVGLWGRLVATNAVQSLVTVITTVSLEHTHVLGNTREAIAGEKAGIIKEGAPVVTGTNGSVLEVLREKCVEKQVSLYRLGEDFRAAGTANGLSGQEMHYRGLSWDYANLKISLLGSYQVDNAAMALAALELLSAKGYELPEESIRRGLQSTRWPGRMEVIGHLPLVVIDGAHNIEAFKALRTSLSNTFSYRKLVLLLGLLEDKAAEEILVEILPLADEIVLTRPNSPRAAAPETLKVMAQKIISKPVLVREEISDAVELTFSLAGEQDLILIAGSLYLISDVRQLLAGRCPETV